MKFNDVPQMSDPGYSTHHCLHTLPKTIKQYKDEQICPLNLEPDFQRVHVWTPEQQTSYIEFLLRGGNSSKDLYFNCPGWKNDYRGPFEIVDGKQRLAACLGFMAGTIQVFGGLYVSDFTDKPRRIYLCFHVNNLKTRREVLQWYLDINAGGVVHTTDELDKVRKLLEMEGS